MQEIWKDIEGYEGRYQISNLGRVKSFARKKPAIMTLKTNWDGYKRIGLRPAGSRSQHFFAVHRLVAEAFMPYPGSDFVEINHIDGDKANNVVDNLEWVTKSENAKHAFRTGLRKPTNGTINGQSKLEDSDILEIRKRVANGETQRKVAADYDISFQHVSDIVNKKRWGWL